MVMARLVLTKLSLVSCAFVSRLYRSDDPLHGELCLSVRVRVAKRMAGNMMTQIDTEQVPCQLGDVGIWQDVPLVDGITDQHNKGLPPDRFRGRGSLSNRSGQEAQLNDGLGDRTTARQSCPPRPSNPYIEVSDQRRQPASDTSVTTEAGAAPKIQGKIKNGSLQVAHLGKMG